MELTQLDQQLKEKEFSQALTSLFQILSNIEKGEEALLADYVQLAELMLACLSEPNCEISDQLFYALLIHQHKIRDLFCLLGNSDLKQQACDWINQNQHCECEGQLAQGLKRYYLCYDWLAHPVLPWPKLAEYQPDWFLAFALSAMAHQTILSEAQLNQLHHFEQHLPEIKTPIIAEHCVPLLVRAWDQLTYRQDGEPLLVQKWLNQLLQNWLHSQVPMVSPPLPDVTRPRILFVLEQFYFHDPVYRNLAPILKLLAHRFDCIALCVEGKMDAKASDLFKQVVSVSWKVPRDIRHIVQQVQQIEPTVLYFPVLGMQSMALCLANMRLAPLQILSPSYAATSAQAEMDHVMIYSEFYHPDAKRSEKPVVLPENQYRVVVPDNLRVYRPHQVKQREVVHIAVPATHYKLSAEFLNRCALIAKKSSRPIQFHFTPNSECLNYYTHRHVIHQYLPDAIVHPRYEYAEYLKMLTECNFALMAMPFAGSNSSIDLCGLAIPFICQLGVEPYAKLDECLSKLVQLPDWCRANSTESYVDAALRLINEPELCQQLSELMFANQYQLHAHTEVATPVDYAEIIVELISSYPLTVEAPPVFSKQVVKNDGAI